MKRLFRYFFYLLSVWISLVLFVVIALMTPALNQWLINKSVQTVPGLSISHVEGALPGNLLVQGISYQDEGSRLHIDVVSSHWHWAALFRGTIQFKALEIRGVDYEHTSSNTDQDAEDNAAFALPVPLQIDRLELQDVTINYFGKDYQLDQLSTALQLSGSQLSIKHLQAHFPEAGLKMDGSLQLKESFPFQISVQGQGAIPQLGNFQGNIKLHGNSEKIDFAQQLILPFPVTASGSVSLQGEQPFIDIQGNWQNLQWPLTGEPEYFSERGDFMIQGPVDSYLVNMNGVVLGTQLPDCTIQIRGAGSAEQFIVDNMIIDTLQGQIKSTGLVNWADHVQWDIQINAEQLDLSEIQPDYHGVINLQTHLTGNTREGLHITAEINQLDGQLLGYPIQGQGKLAYDGSSLAVTDMVLQAGDNRLRAQGRLGDNSVLDYSLDVKDLSLFRADLSGSVTATGTVIGRLQNPVVELAMRTDALQFAKYKVGKASLDARIATANAGQLSLSAQLQQLTVNETNIDNIDLKASGSFTAHTLNALITAPQGQMNLALSGIFQQQLSRWQGEIKSWELTGTPLGSWKMAKTTTLDVSYIDSNVLVNSSDLCMQKIRDNATVCLKADAGKGKVQGVAGQVKKFPLAELSPWLPDKMLIQSRLSAQFVLHLQEALSGKLAVSLTPGVLKFSSDQQKHQVPFSEFELEADLQNDDLNVQLGLLLNEQDSIAGKVSLQPFSKLDQGRIDGQMSVQIADIGFLNALELPVKQIKGSLHSEIIIQGPAASPEIKRFDTRLDSASFFVPETGVEIADLTIAAKHKTNALIEVQGSFNIDGGKALLQGRINQVQHGSPELSLSLQGEQLKVVQLPEAEIWTTLDLRFLINRESVDIQGKLLVPKARISFVELPENAVAVSQDEVIITAEAAPPREKDLPVKAKIAILLGDDVTLKGFGLSTKLQGELEADYANKRFRLFKQLNLIDGTYQAYGQDLSIEKGQLLFQGAVDNPGINILASRRATKWDDNVVAYFAMTGTLLNAKTRVYTKPALPESEALAYLLTGGPFDKSSSSGASMLAKAAMSYGKDYIDSVMGSVGIDEVDVKETSMGENSFILGKRITPQLYVRYIMDVITARMILTAEYKLTEHISIEGKSGDTHGGDIKYSIEFD